MKLLLTGPSASDALGYNILSVSGVVLESYGSGNIPSNRDDVVKEIAAAVKRGVIVVNITQCNRGAVASPIYETGRVSANLYLF